MRILWGASLALLLVPFINGCTKQQQNSEAAKVDTGSVHSVLVGTSPGVLADCAEAIEARNGKVLFQSESGLLFSDLQANQIDSNKCKANISDNAPIKLEEKPAAKPAGANDKPAVKEDLSTILRLVPAEEIGARSFVKANPNFDGRGVVVAVLDTGVELDHPMLAKTSTGAIKVINANDFSGEGRVTLKAVEAKDGVLNTDRGAYAVKALTGKEYQFGVFAGSSLKYSDDVAGVDTFVDLGVVTYAVDGKRATRVDTNNDKSFDDEAELFNYGEGNRFTKIGAKRLLTVAVNASEDGSVAVLHFDDGSHGTHVAGIATGNEPGGLQGVAPGAQVISAKIGDNRLAGGSTTTASMLLAIDWAVKQKADVINLSYGIRAGSNTGKSAIDQYIDKVAKESGVLFSISAGNEGPGLLTIGTPAAAELAITNGAYVSAQTAKDNYGYVNFEDNTVWYFSSVGPRLDGGLKPTLLAPGSALSSVPLWEPSKHLNYRGTSMASPQTTGGLALVLSAARQSGLLSDRASVTRAVYDSATPVEGLSLIEQGHGLFSVPRTVELLGRFKQAPVEYTISVNSNVAPSGRGAGIFVRDPANADNLFTVSVTPSSKGALPLRTFRLASDAWVKTPGSLWMEGPAAKTFQVALAYDRLGAGIHSQLIQAIDEATGLVAFEVPVTVIVPTALSAANQYRYESTRTQRVGQTLRHFIQIPPGATAATVELSSDGPVVWAQLLDAEGRKIAELLDSEGTSPLPVLTAQAAIERGGLYEIDVVAPATIRRPVKATVKVQAYSLNVTKEVASEEGLFNVIVENRFLPVKLVPKVEIPALKAQHEVAINGNIGNLAFKVDERDRESVSGINFTVETSKKLYDLMTDYPFRVFDAEGGMVLAGGLELKSLVELPAPKDLSGSEFRLEIQGAFTKAPPDKWLAHVTERRQLAEAVGVMELSRTLWESGQFRELTVDLRKVTLPARDGFTACAVLKLNSPDGKLVQATELCD